MTEENNTLKRFTTPPDNITENINNNELFSPFSVHNKSQNSFRINSTSQRKISNVGLGSVRKIFNKFTSQALNLQHSMTNQEDNNYFEIIKRLNFEDSTKKGSHLSMRFRNLIIISFEIVVFFLNLLSVLDLIYLSEYRTKILSPSYVDSLKYCEWIVMANFSFEIVISFLIKKVDFSNRIVQIFTFDNIVNIFSIMEIVYSTLYCENFERNNVFFIFISVLRSFKLFKVWKMAQTIIKEFSLLIKNDNVKTYSKKEQDDIKYFVYTSSVEIIISIFIESTLCISFNETLDFQGYGNSSGPVKFDYRVAYYYMIVSMTSIGYGDIFPLKWLTRLCTICLLFYDIIILSNYIGQLIEHIYKLSPYIKNFHYSNHIVIIGSLPISFLKYFANELHQCDIITSSVYQENQKISAPSKIIVIGDDDPPKELETWFEDFSEKYIEIKYLKSNILETLWYKQANLINARRLFAFSMNPNIEESERFELDKQMSYNIQKVVSHYPKLEITMVLSSEFNQLMKKDAFWTNVETISAQTINEYIMANSLENQGLNVWLSHLATLREKNEPKTLDQLNDLKDYSINMNQEIYPIKLPQYFVGKKFQEALKIIYFSSFDLLDLYSFDYSTNQKNQEPMPSKPGLLLIGIEHKDELLHNMPDIYLNPIDYEIQTNDIGFVIAFDQVNAQALSKNTELERNLNFYHKNINYFKKSPSEEKSTQLILQMADKLDGILKDWDIKKKKYFKKSGEIQELNHKALEIPTVFNIFENSSPKGIFRNHIIVKGHLDCFGKIAFALRTYSERPILLFSDQAVNASEWIKIRNILTNVFYVHGNTTNIKHILQLDPKKASKILILSSSKNNFIMDSESIVFTRTIADFFELNNFLTEIMEDVNMKYLSINPKYDENNYFFWPYFTRGSIHFSSLSMSFIAKSIINRSWVSLIKKFIKPTKMGKVHNNFQENSKINSLIITEEGEKWFQCFGQLQYALMNSKPSVIAIAVMKAKIQIKDKKQSTLMTQMTLSQNKKIVSQLSKLMDNFYGNEFLMTNPSVLMPLKKGDKILVMGNIKDLEDEGFFKKKVNSSFMITTPKEKGEIDSSSKKNAHFTFDREYQKQSIGLIKEKIIETLTSVNSLLSLINEKSGENGLKK